MFLARRRYCRALVVVFSCGVLASCGERESAERYPKLPSLTSAALSVADCPAGYQVIQGTNGPDTLNGSSANDCIIGLGGADVINGGGGNDYIAGGDGNDSVFGGSGNDAIYGEAGNDTLQGDGADDSIDGGDGDDLIQGSAGTDTLRGGAGRDRLNGGDTGDTLYGGADDDVLHGDAANDTLYGEGGDDILDGDANNDTLWGGDGDDVLYGDTNNDTLNGEAGDDALLGGAGTNILNGGTGTDACSGTSCEKPSLTLSGCTQDSQCTSGTHCIADFGLCIGCVSDQDGDQTCDSKDGCPNDSAKASPGTCGCGVSDADGDGDGSANCVDGCPSDAAKQAPGTCGCGISDADGDGDGSANCVDGCPSDAAKQAAGICGCGVSDADGDGDGTANCLDGCPSDAAKLSAGVCGCGVSDADGDGDGTANCLDGCPSDAAKQAAGICGCGVSDADSDGDGAPNCLDGCPGDPAKLAAGVCGCGVSDADGDGDGTANCLDGCPTDPAKLAAGSCGCGNSDADGDADGTPNCLDGCPSDPAKLAAGVCGCGVSDADGDGDGTANCLDGCPSDAAKLAAGVCGCGVSDADGDGDGTANCLDGCPSDAAKLSAGVCGCGVSDIDTDADGHADCIDACPGSDDELDADSDGTPDGCEVPTECTPDTVGIGVYQGTAYAYGPGDLDALNGVTCITGSLIVSGQSSLASLSSLRWVAGSVTISFNPDLATLEGLENLEQIGGSLEIQFNPALHSIEELGSLETLGAVWGSWGLYVSVNDALPACQVWALEAQTGRQCGAPEYGFPCDQNRGAGSCGALPPDFACVPGASGPGVYDGDLIAPDDAALSAYGGVTCVTGGVGLGDVTDLAGLSQLQKIGGTLSVVSSRLTSLAGLDQLTEIGGELAINGNNSLQDISSLSHLSSLGARLFPGSNPLQVAYNQVLPACQAWDLAAQTQTSCKSNSPYATGLDRCWGNLGSGACGSLPPDFACVPGAVGPGVYDDNLDLANLPWPGLQALGGLRCVTGNLGLAGASDLSGLSGLQHVGGWVSVNDLQRADLSGLENLISVGGYLDISGNESLTSVAGLSGLRRVGQWFNVSYNPELRDLSALEGLNSIGAALPDPSGALSIRNNASLPGCHAWGIAGRTGTSCYHQSIWGGLEYSCAGNTGTGSCGSLPADFACVPGAVGPGVFDGNVAYDGPPPNELAGLTCVTGNLWLFSRNDLSALSTLQKVGGDLSIQMNADLTSLAGLENLTQVGKHLYISSNPALQSLSGLANLTSVGAALPDSSAALQITYNPALTACHAWSLAAQVDSLCQGLLNGVWVNNCYENNGSGGCGDLPPGFACMPGAVGPGVVDGDLAIWNEAMAHAYAGVTCVTGEVFLSGQIESAHLAALSNLQQVGGDLRIQSSQALTNVDELARLTQVRGHLRIEGNAALTDLGGLRNLVSLGASFPGDNQLLQIGSNAQLPACWALQLETQTGAACLVCGYNTGTSSCGTLPPGFACVPGASGPGIYDGSVVYEADINRYRGVTCITGDVVVSPYYYWPDLTALEHLQKLGGSLRINGTNLANIDGLENLTDIGRQLSINGNGALTNLDGLSSLSSLGAASPAGEFPLDINSNAQLPACWVAALETQTGEQCVIAEPAVACWGNDGEGSCPP